MSCERLWERLFDFLNGWSTAAEIGPGRIEVAVENPGLLDQGGRDLDDPR